MSVVDVLAGLYAGIGLCLGIWYYVDPDPWTQNDPRMIRVLRAVVVMATWVIWVVIVGCWIVEDEAGGGR